MTKDLEVKKGGVPATLNEDATAALKRQFEKQLRGANTYKLFPSIGIQHGIKKPKFEVENYEETDALEGTIISYTIAREFYPDAGTKVPECTSTGGKCGTMHGSCSSCTHNKWGTGANGVGRACKEYRKLMLALTDKPGFFEMKIPATSLKSFDEYANNLVLKNKLPLGGAITKITLDTKEDKGRKPFSIAVFTFVKSLLEGEKAFVEMVAKALTEYENVYRPTELPINVTPVAAAVPDDAHLKQEKLSGKITEIKGDSVPF